MLVGTQLLTAEDIAALVRLLGRDQLMDEMIDALRRVFESHRPDEFDARTRDGFRYEKPDLGLVEWMPSHELGGPVVVKMVGYHPTNPLQRGLPSVLATSSLWDTDTGHLAAIADATFLTAIRTGAVSAIATDILAKEGPVEVGVVGLGAQSVTQLHALSRVRPLSRIRGYDVSDEAANSFVDRVAFLGVETSVVPAEQLDELVAGADVLVTCTSVDIGAGPVLPEVSTRPWLHVNAVGADFPGKTELPRSLLDGADIFPDSRAQCVAEGECQILEPESIGPELYEIVQQEQHFIGHRRRTTVFDSTGWALEDDVALRLALRLAGEHGLGRTVQIESISVDPLDPYSFPDPSPPIGVGPDGR